MSHPARLLPFFLASLLVPTVAHARPLPCDDGQAAAAVAGSTAEELVAPTELFEVLRVVDGDTIHIRRKGEYVKLRLLSVDTEERLRGGEFDPGKPETVFGEECAKWAIRFFADLAGEDGKTHVGLRFPGDREEVDAYGRLLCHVILPDGRDFNLMLVQLGKSPYFNKYGNSRICHAAFVAAQERARAERLGIWDPATNEPRTEGAPAAKRDYERLMSWWNARAAAIDAFRDRADEHPETAIASEDARAIEDAIAAKRKVELFGTIDRFFEESNGDLTVLMRAVGDEKGVRAVVPHRLRAELAEALDLEATREAFRQNYVVVRGVLTEGRRGPMLRTDSVDDWRLGGPEPVQPLERDMAEAGAPR